MRTSLLLATAFAVPVLAFAASLLASGPARADVHQLGAVNVSADHYTMVSWTRFDGPVEKLTFIPTTDAVDCSHITINYLDGTSHEVFSGALLKDQTETISFPESDSRLASVDFACKAASLDGARIDLSSVSDGPRTAYDRYESYRDAALDRDMDVDRAAHLRTYEEADLDR